MTLASTNISFSLLDQHSARLQVTEKCRQYQGRISYPVTNLYICFVVKQSSNNVDFI